jgi:iron complex transport system substrate-binding protein
MGAGAHLVGVSNYDINRPGIEGLPRVGDYQQFDWEQIGTLRPDLMIVFMAADRVPEALQQRSDQLGIELVNVRPESLEDAFKELERLGRLLNELEKAAITAGRLREQLATVRKRVEGRPRVRTLMMHTAGGEGVVGRGNFLNDLLELAGGENVIEASGWKTIDREQLMAMKPEVIIQLLPEASEQVVEQAKRTMASAKGVPAVDHGQVFYVTEWWAVQPGMQMGVMAERMAGMLHGGSDEATKRRSDAGAREGKL